MKKALKSGMQAVVSVPASVANLGPGFDALGLAIALRNRYVFRLHPQGAHIDISGEGADELPRDASHLAYRSFAYTMEKLGHKLSGLEIVQTNQIPFAGGLGNSATAVVAGVTAATVFAGVRLSIDEMLKIATEIEGHPDNVAPALLGGLVVCAGNDAHDVKYIHLPVPENLQAVLAVPDFTLNTTLARQVLPSHVPLKDAAFNVGHASLLMAAFCTGKFELLAAAMQDKLHQPYRAHLVPGLEQVCRDACRAGALGAALAGAGPTVMAFAKQVYSNQREVEGIGAAMVNAFASCGIKSRYIIANLCYNGVTVEQTIAAVCD